MGARRKADLADRVNKHRARLRAQGLCPVQIWVPDVRTLLRCPGCPPVDGDAWRRWGSGWARWLSPSCWAGDRPPGPSSSPSPAPTGCTSAISRSP
ncbi:MAG: DUF3018 family protein [Acidimicrobiia bacterium]|nr:DUF3018 family protein [Acidimicrobiia bacterium]